MESGPFRPSARLLRKVVRLTLLLTIFFRFCFSSAFLFNKLGDGRVDIKVRVPENVFDLSLGEAVAAEWAEHFECLGVRLGHRIVVFR